VVDAAGDPEVLERCVAEHGWQRLDPVLRTVAMTRTNFSLPAIKLMREPFNDRHRDAAAKPQS